AGEQVALLRLLDVRIQGLEATDLDHLQQLVHQHQQLPLEFLATALVDDDAADLAANLEQHFLGIADHQAAQAGADDDQRFGGLPEHPQVTVGEGIATKYANDNDECAQYLLHDAGLRPFG